MTKNQVKVLSLDHRTFSYRESGCITPPMWSRDMHPYFPMLQVWLSEKTNSASRFWFFLHSLQLYSGFLLSVISMLLWKLPSFVLFSLHCTKNCECSYLLFAIYSSPLQGSSLIKLSSFDLEVSRVSFSVKEKNLIVLDGRLHYYSCIWFELIVFQLSKVVFNSKSQSVVIIFLSSFEEKIVSTVVLKR